jgi:hypothetical protein
LYAQELAFANDLADRAGEIGLSYFRGSFEVHEKADRTPVTEIVARLGSRRGAG